MRLLLGGRSGEGKRIGAFVGVLIGPVMLWVMSRFCRPWWQWDRVGRSLYVRIGPVGLTVLWGR